MNTAFIPARTGENPLVGSPGPCYNSPMAVTTAERRNFLALLIDAAGYPLGMSFLSIQVILPGFLGEMGANNLLIGLVPALANLGLFLPPVFMAAWTERRDYVRLPLFYLAVLERLPLALLGIAAWRWVRGNPALLLLAFFFCWGWNNLVTGLNMPLYMTLVAKASHPARRGLLFGLGGAAGGFLGAIGAVLSRAVLLRFGFPTGYALCFAAGFGILILSILPFPFMDEPRHDPAPQAPGLRQHLRGLPGLLRDDRGFALYILAQSALILATVAGNFLAAAAMRQLGADIGQLGLYNVILMATTSLAGLLLGFLADRHGHRLVLELTGLAASLAAASALLAPASPGLMLLAFFLTAFTTAGLSLSAFNIVLEFSGPARAATYTALCMLLTVPVRFGAPLLAGAAADRYGYAPVFLGSALSGLIAVVLLRSRVPEPRRFKSEVGA